MGKKPSMTHMRVFRCTAYAHVPGEVRRKMDFKASKNVFIGYTKGIKGYKLLEPSSKQISHARDVIFSESSFIYQVAVNHNSHIVDDDELITVLDEPNIFVPSPATHRQLQPESKDLSQIEEPAIHEPLTSKDSTSQSDQTLQFGTYVLAVDNQAPTVDPTPRRSSRHHTISPWNGTRFRYRGNPIFGLPLT